MSDRRNYLVSIFGRKSARLLELDFGNQCGLQVGDAHDACVLNVDLAHDQVVDGRGDLQYMHDHMGIWTHRLQHGSSRIDIDSSLLNDSCQIYCVKHLKSHSQQCMSVGLGQPHQQFGVLQC